MKYVCFNRLYRSRLGLIAAFLVCISIVSSALAGTTATYSTQGDYAAAVGIELFFVDFNNSPNTTIGGNTIDPNIVFASPEAATSSEVLWSSNALSDAGSTSAPNNVGPIEGVFNTPLQAFSFDFVGGSVSETVMLYDSSDNLIDSLTAPNPTGFFGVTSAMPISKFRIYSGLQNGLPQRVFIDNLQANTIPEPATMCLVVTGGLIFLRNKKR